MHALSDSLKAVSVAAGFFLLAFISIFAQTVVPGQAAPCGWLWIPAGFAVAALIVDGTHLWPAVTLGAFLSAFIWMQVPLPCAFIIAAGATFETGVVVWALRRMNDDGWRLRRVRDAATLVIMGGVIGSGASATAGTLSLLGAGIISVDGVFETWRSWWLSHCLGTIVVGAVLLTWRQLRWPGMEELLEGMGMLGGAALVLALGVMGVPAAAWATVLVILASFTVLRFGQSTVMRLISGLVVATMVLVVTHTGAFRESAIEELQLFVIGLTTAALLLGSFHLETTGRLKRAAAAVAARDAFLSTMANELRTPLAAIQNEMELSRLDAQWLGQGKEARVVVRALDHHVKQVRTAVGSLFDVSQMACGRLELQSEWMDLAELVRERCSANKQQVRSSGCELTVLAGTPVVGRWDRQRLGQVLDIILEHAALGPSGQPVTLAVEGRGTSARLIAEHAGWTTGHTNHRNTPVSFEELVTTGNTHGAGLGWWVARNIVEALGGTLHVHRSGGRAKILIELPGRVERTLPTMNVAAERSGEILVVDDDPDILEALSGALLGEGYRVMSASHGGIALEMLRAGLRPRVILLDLVMPVTDGWEFLRTLSLDPRLERIPVWLLSGAPQLRVMAKGLPIAGQLQKPITLDELLDAVRAQPDWESAM